MTESLYPSLTPINNNNNPNENLNTNTSNDNNYKSGWLQKKGDGVVQSWKKRYFVVDPESIKYYTDDSKKNQKGSILWNTILSIDFTKFKLSSDTRYFQISTNKSNRIYYLFAEDQLIALDWVNYLQTLLQQYFTFTNNNNNNSSSSSSNGDNNNIGQEQQQYYDSEEPYNIEQQQQFNNNNNFNNNNESQYKDFLNYTTPYFSHYSSIMNHNSNGNSPYGGDSGMNGVGNMNLDSKLGILVPPPRPPGQLRTLTTETIKEIIPIEGMDLEIYYQSTCYFSNMLLTMGDDYNILSVYLILSILDWDNKKSQPLPYPCTPPYESDIVFPYFLYSHQLARNEVLQRWKSEGPSYCTQIDNFAKKKRKYYTLLLENEDRETFLQRNLLLLSHCQCDLLPGSRLGQLEDSIMVLMDRFIENLEALPSIKFSNSLFKEIEAAQIQQSQTMLANSPTHGMNNNSNDEFLLPSIAAQQLSLSEDDRTILKNFVYSYLLFQKFHLERKNNDKIPFSSSLSQKIENVGHCFSQTLQKSPLISPFQNHIRTRMLRIFFIWQKDLPLCETTCSHEISNYRNFKVFSRMASKINSSMFPQLYNSIKDVKQNLYQYIEPLVGTLDLNNMDNFPIDSLI